MAGSSRRRGGVDRDNSLNRRHRRSSPPSHKTHRRSSTWVLDEEETGYHRHEKQHFRTSTKNRRRRHSSSRDVSPDQRYSSHHRRRSAASRDFWVGSDGDDDDDDFEDKTRQGRRASHRNPDSNTEYHLYRRKTADTTSSSIHRSSGTDGHKAARGGDDSGSFKRRRDWSPPAEGQTEHRKTTDKNSLLHKSDEVNDHGSRATNNSSPAATEPPQRATKQRYQQRMPAINMPQQQRLMRFLDARDAQNFDSRRSAANRQQQKGWKGGRSNEAEAEQIAMPPPPTFVRRGGGGGGDSSSISSSIQQQLQNHLRHSTAAESGRDIIPSCEQPENDNDGNMSDASHESVCSNNDDGDTFGGKQRFERGVLPYTIPPRELHRVALYGVDLSITPGHLSSMAEQLVGCRPWRSRRPATELAACFATAATCPRTVDDGEEKSSGGAGILSRPQDPVLQDGGDAFGGEQGSTAAESSRDLTCTSRGGAMETSSLLHLPGLYDTAGPGGMVVLEFKQLAQATQAVKLLNGAFVNGRRVAATMQQAMMETPAVPEWGS